KCIPASGELPNDLKSCILNSTTIPEFAVGWSRRLGDQPLVTTSPGLVAHGAMIPPGHMQNEYMPLPSICLTMLYGDGGKYAPRSSHLYCILSINCCGCSTLTPRAKALASISMRFFSNNSKIS